MKVLLIGGTGTISTAITRKLAEMPEWEVYLLNRGTHMEYVPEGVKVIQADISDEEKIASLLEGQFFDVVGEFVGFVPEQVERDIRLFRGKTKQYIYISSAATYQKPCRSHIITEGTLQENTCWPYAQNKIACEQVLLREMREKGFPVTIVRPSHTYGERAIPMSVCGKKGSWQVARRMLAGKPVIIQGDGTSLWHMTFNEDFAQGYIGLMGNPHAIGEVFQITNDEVLTWNQIFHCIADALGVPLHPYYISSYFLSGLPGYDFRGSLLGDQANSVVFDNSKLKRIVPEFRPAIHFEQGIRRTVNYILTHPECQIEDPEFDAWCDRVIAAQEAARKSLMTP